MAQTPTPPVIILTGGIASGKTAVSDRLGKLGARVIDTDQIAHDLVRPGQAGLAAICQHFGTGVLDQTGALNRQAMRQRIFDDPEARRQLEAILHPLIESETRTQLAVPTSAPYVVLVVPLLIESGLFADVSPVIVVDAPESVQLERLILRDGITEQQARQMLAAQASRPARLARADHVIQNQASLSELIEQVDQLHSDLLASFQRPASGKA